MLWFKKEKTSCTTTDEEEIKMKGGSKYREIVTPRGSHPPADGKDWFDQVFDVEPIKFQLAPIINLFTDITIGQNKIKTCE